MSNRSTWLSENRDRLEKDVAGLNLPGVSARTHPSRGDIVFIETDGERSAQVEIHWSGYSGSPVTYRAHRMLRGDSSLADRSGNRTFKKLSSLSRWIEENCSREAVEALRMREQEHEEKVRRNMTARRWLMNEANAILRERLAGSNIHFTGRASPSARFSPTGQKEDGKIRVGLYAELEFDLSGNPEIAADLGLVDGPGGD